MTIKAPPPPTNANSFAYALFTFLLGRLEVPREDEDSAYAKLFVCIGGKKHANKVYYGGCENGFVVPKEDEDKAYAKLFACIGGKKHVNKVYYWGCGKGEWRRIRDGRAQ